MEREHTGGLTVAFCNSVIYVLNGSTMKNSGLNTARITWGICIPGVDFSLSDLLLSPPDFVHFVSATKQRSQMKDFNSGLRRQLSCIFYNKKYY